MSLVFCDFTSYLLTSDSIEPGTGNWPYTIPAIKFPDGTWAQDSRKIADLIEERYPERPVHLDSPYQARIEAAVPKTVMPLMAIAINQVPCRLLNQRSVDYWLVDRAKMVGCDVAQFEAEKGGEPAYVAAEAGLKDVTDMLKENPDGPFFGGKDLCYADFVWVGALYFFKRIGEDFYENIMKHTSDRKVHDDLLKAAEPWLKRGDH